MLGDGCVDGLLADSAGPGAPDVVVLAELDPPAGAEGGVHVLYGSGPISAFEPAYEKALVDQVEAVFPGGRDGEDGGEGEGEVWRPGDTFGGEAVSLNVDPVKNGGLREFAGDVE